MEIIKKEKNIKEYPSHITIEKIELILEQMKNCVCKIFLKKGVTGTGFICKISVEDSAYYVLITNYHIINDKYLENNKQIVYKINNNEENNILNIKNRKIYLNEKYDIAIIELNEQINRKYYLELDDNLFKENIEICYEGITVYDIQYPKEDNISVSFGTIREIQDSVEIIHLCCTDSGSSGSPILNLKTNKIIGIHKEACINFNFNKGTFLKKPINEYIKKYYGIPINDSNNPMLYKPSNQNKQNNINIFKYKEMDIINLNGTNSEEGLLHRYNYNSYFGCWNEVLRCLCSIYDFVAYFKEHKFNVGEDNFLSSFKTIFDEMTKDINLNSFNKEYIPFKIVDFRKIIKKIEKNSTREILDKYWLSPEWLVGFILENLHEDLKKVEKNKDCSVLHFIYWNYYQNTSNYEKFLSTRVDGVKIEDDPQKKIIKHEHKTIIAKLFFGVERRDNKYNHSILDDSVFSTIKYNDNRYQKYNNYNERERHSLLYDSDGIIRSPIFQLSIPLKKYEGPLIKVGDSNYYTDNLIQIPKIIIHSPRSENYLLDFKCGGYNYTLIGLIGTRSEHVGTSKSTEIVHDWKVRFGEIEDDDYEVTYTTKTYINNFFCICRDFKTKKWFKYSGDEIIEIQEKNVVRPIIEIKNVGGNEVTEEVRLLFYEKKESNFFW